MILEDIVNDVVVQTPKHVETRSLDSGHQRTQIEIGTIVYEQVFRDQTPLPWLLHLCLLQEVLNLRGLL
jgi:hypothetical protein